MAMIESRLVEYLHQKAGINQIPLSGVFEVSPICNMDCSMCYVKKTAAEVKCAGGLLSLQQWIQIAQEARDRGMLFILLTGGEPFLRSDFCQLYKALHKMGFVLSINSNATLITKETMGWLKEMPPSRINVTVYGASDETYERLCGNPKGYTQLKRGVDLLLEAGITVKLSSSITPHNVQDLEGIIRFAKERDLILEATPYMFPPIRKDETKVGVNERMTAEETSETFAKLTYLQYGEEYMRSQMEHWEQQEQQTRALIEKSPEKEGMRLQCRAGTSTCWITWDGKMLPCGMMVNPITNPLQEGFSKAWRQLREEVLAIRLPVKCSNCEKRSFCHTCAAMVYAETGAYDVVPQYRCAMVDSYFGACKKYLT